MGLRIFNFKISLIRILMSNKGLHQFKISTTTKISKIKLDLRKLK
jgi:hypothetical protein